MKKGPHYQSKILYSSHSKGTIYPSQLQITQKYFEDHTVSRFMAAVATGIPIQNICRYVDSLFKSDDIAIIRKDHCRITGEIVEYLSCNKSLFPKRPVQAELCFGKENEPC